MNIYMEILKNLQIFHFGILRERNMIVAEMILMVIGQKLFMQLINYYI